MHSGDACPGEGDCRNQNHPCMFAITVHMRREISAQMLLTDCKDAVPTMQFAGWCCILQID
eukprot:CAMPEP_0172764166 /NCGR_PEP_ID=MMETSP1074-20121228/176768_1 /TAXON_ID=2916 /ORGANISM="Ceratium fusus, Strain PA161109" /LENGTH=60 /DNA_ID=CAMNT_0013598883 /DNA_START=146 /DNA_END=328 /DNA_ORIENTATION=-